jgi:hypothetical protein
MSIDNSRPIISGRTKAIEPLIGTQLDEFLFKTSPFIIGGRSCASESRSQKLVRVHSLSAPSLHDAPIVEFSALWKGLWSRLVSQLFSIRVVGSCTEIVVHKLFRHLTQYREPKVTVP